jgi:1-acyl-sn-glycerol-3-phosphate acyltransferase
MILFLRLMIKKFLIYVYTVYVWVSGSLYFLFATVLGISLVKISTPKKIDPFFKHVLRFLFRIIFVRVKVEYEEKLKTGKTYVFMANHVSIVDVPLMGAYLPGFCNAIEADSHFRWPVYKHLIKNYGQIPIDRSNVRASLKSMQTAEERLKNGVSIIVFPEGHRTDDGNIQEFKKLPFLMAQRAGAEIVPIGISGMWHFSPRDSFVFRPSKLKIKFGKPIATLSENTVSPEDLMQITRDKIISLVERQ